MALAILCAVMSVFIYATLSSAGEVFVAATTLFVAGSLLYGLYKSESTSGVNVK